MTQFARRIGRLQPSLVREILAVASGSDIISLAGGLPAAEAMTLPSMPPSGWEQYGASEGEAALREEISRLLKLRGLECPSSRIILTTGSQQGLDLAAKLLVDEGTPVALEAPTYLAALQVFRLFGADLRGVDSGMTGPRQEDLPKVFLGHAPALFYAMPLISNPTGGTWNEASRRKLASLCDETGTVLVEDDPYRETSAGNHPAPLVASLERAPWIHLGSFSKSLLPGIRLGFLASSESLYTPLLRLKQAADLHSSRLSQAIALADLRDPSRHERIERLQAIYAVRREAFARSLRQELPEAEWDAPDGGMFFWARLPGIDTMALLEPCMKSGVAFLPGCECLPRTGVSDWMRLNFSSCDPIRAREGLRRIRVCAESVRSGRELA
jgi:DNA-binding transcriptional MocR family regulator